ncbi:hypothetical protein HPB50_026017 [Hyalomma asiaticum]|uniref:Uncharacterized protein n=1 Tax=Hyalomma asiaticum TaxID=266040 RepID=A0ACB7TR35_HYAAI|nr:hypothetical protein HPB50_026017 [Hyalomma asiaticum]
MDLKRQLILMQQQLEDKDRTIHLLQQQMTKYMDITNVEKDPVKVNAAVQTERCQAAFRDKIEDVSKSLSNITQALRLYTSKPHLPSRSQSSSELLS